MAHSPIARLAGALAVCLALHQASGGAPLPAECPQALDGIWSTELPVAELFTVEVTIGALSDKGGEAVLRTGGTSETVPVWRTGERVRFQSGLPALAFDGSVEPDGSIVGFAAVGSNLTRVRRSGWTSGACAQP